MGVSVIRNRSTKHRIGFLFGPLSKQTIRGSPKTRRVRIFPICNLDISMGFLGIRCIQRGTHLLLSKRAKGHLLWMVAKSISHHLRNPGFRFDL